MNILEIIEKKRDKKELTKQEIEYFVKGYVNEKIADYQAAALIMAIYLNGNDKTRNNKINNGNGTFWRNTRFNKTK